MSSRGQHPGLLSHEMGQAVLLSRESERAADETIIDGLVRKKGLEPLRPFGHQLLRLARLPIPPLPRWNHEYNIADSSVNASDRPGLEAGRSVPKLAKPSNLGVVTNVDPEDRLPKPRSASIESDSGIALALLLRTRAFLTFRWPFSRFRLGMAGPAVLRSYSQHLPLCIGGRRIPFLSPILATTADFFFALAAAACFC